MKGMGYRFDLDLDWGVFECDQPGCDKMEGFEGTDQKCRRDGKDEGWKARQTGDGVMTVCPGCAVWDD